MADVSYVDGPWQAAVERRLATWADASFGARLWRKDGRLWSETPVPEIDGRLGWLEAPFAASAALDGLRAFAAEIRAEGYERILLLGMGGSSLAPLVYREMFGPSPGAPDLTVLDTVHPDAVASVGQELDWRRTLVMASSKSGTTGETRALLAWAWTRAAESGAPGRRFVAVTDPGSPLARLGAELGFRRVWHGVPEVGGRYSALTVFGLLPAALLGVDVARLAALARELARASREAPGPEADPGLAFGAWLGELARAGRDKVTFLLSPSLEAFGLWAEQLLAESTGKSGRGLVPVVGEPPGDPDRYGPDRVFVEMALRGETVHGDLAAELAGRGHPLVRIRLGDRYELGAEFLRWEVAVAAAGSLLGVNPFDQPDVEVAKAATRRLLTGWAREGQPPPSAGVDPDDHGALSSLLASSPPGGYIAVQAYVAPTPAVAQLISRLQGALRDRTGLAATAGFGPRYLHSTGQLHKGGPPTGVFLQLVDEPVGVVPVPGEPYDLGTLLRAEADGDRETLLALGRPVLRVQLGRDVGQGLERLVDAIAGSGGR